MCRPSDEDLPRKLLMAALAETFARTCKREGLDPRQLRVHLSMDNFLALASVEPIENLQEQLGHSGFRGAVVGDLLNFLLNCAECAPEHASVNKAIFVVMADLTGTRLRDGSRPTAGRSILHEAWREFKPVAHLWAAFRLWQEEFQQTPEFDPRTPTGLRGFLALAKELHARAVNIRARGRTKAILDPSETWRVPATLLLPAITLQLPPLPDWARARLHEYKESLAKR